MAKTQYNYTPVSALKALSIGTTVWIIEEWNKHYTPPAPHVIRSQKADETDDHFKDYKAWLRMSFERGELHFREEK